MKTSNRVWGGLLLMALGLFGAAAAFAQNTAPPDMSAFMQATNSDTDLSMNMWRQVFGSQDGGRNFVDSPFRSLGGPQSLLGMLFVVFNAVIFAVGMAYLGYGVVSGIVGTAQEGQALGQRINTAWYPIRVVTGISGMIPVLGGFTISQGILMSIATLGIGIANTLSTAAVDGAQFGLFRASAVTSSPSVINNREVVESLLRMNVCTMATKMHEEEKKALGLPAIPELLVAKRAVPTDSGLVITAGSAMYPKLCGQVSVSKETREPSSFMGTGYRVASVNYAGISRQVLAAHRSALISLDRRLEGVATRWLTVERNGAVGAESNYEKIISEEARWYASEVDRAVAAALADPGLQGINESTKTRMKSDGWLGIGSWSNTFAEVNAALADAAGGVKMDSQRPRYDQVVSYASDAMRSFDRVVQDAATSMAKSPGSAGADAEIGWLAKLACDSGVIDRTPTGNCSMGQSIVKNVIDLTSVGSGGGELVNPIIGLKNVGDYMLTLTSSVFFADAASSLLPSGGVAKLASAVTSTGLGEKASTLVSTIGMLFFAAGAYLSLYLPMIPFIIWVGAVIAYAASFVEGLVAMPLHSLSHLHTDGEGMGQQTSQGYLFYLNTLARPSLMVIAFVFANALVIALGTIFTTLYLPTMANVQGDSVTGALSIFGFVAIYGVIMTIIINASFDLIQVIPDQVIGYVGAGSVSTKLGSDTEGKINQMFLMTARMGPQVKGGVKPKSGGDGQKMGR